MRLSGRCGAEHDGRRLRRPRGSLHYHRLLEDGYDCAFGSRFVNGHRVYRYPTFKLVVNRIANWAIRLLFRHGLDDTTNGFSDRREVIETVQPLLAKHFNLSGKNLPLKAIVRGHSYAIVPISYTERLEGKSKFYIKEVEAAMCSSCCTFSSSTI